MTSNHLIHKKYEVVIVGGGISGICAAIASARQGVKTALIQNRPVLGGNASSEIRMHICGADNHASRTNARETGIIEEILLENKRRNPNHSFSILDTVMWEKVRFQEGLDLYLNTHVDDAVVENSVIRQVMALQLSTEKRFVFEAEIFMDATGDGTLAAIAGAEYRYGREGKAVFQEKYAPEESDTVTMGNTLLFKAVDTGSPVPFIKPQWANTYQEEDLAYRSHQEFSSGYWWIELGGDESQVIEDGEELRDELLKAVYGVWDHIKNSGHHEAENYALDWVGFLPGKRESRRVLGDYVLKEQDCLEGRSFEDAIAYGGWPMDMHVEGGLRTRLEPTNFIFLKDVYTIPYRCLYSKNINNLMLAGRIISASHMAFGSTRVMATCGVIGQAGGTAAAMAVKKGILPRGMLIHIKELQQELLRQDCYIPGFHNEDREDLAKQAHITCSSHKDNYSCEAVVNGVSRQVREDANCWVSREIGSKDEWISFQFTQAVTPRHIHLKFDSNLSGELMTSLSDSVRLKQTHGIPPELVKDYVIEFYKEDLLVYSEEIKDNYLRFRIHSFAGEIECDQVRVKVRSTNGDKHVRIFEVRIYE